MMSASIFSADENKCDWSMCVQELLSFCALLYRRREKKHEKETKNKGTFKKEKMYTSCTWSSQIFFLFYSWHWNIHVTFFLLLLFLFTHWLTDFPFFFLWLQQSKGNIPPWQTNSSMKHQKKKSQWRFSVCSVLLFLSEKNISRKWYDHVDILSVKNVASWIYHVDKRIGTHRNSYKRIVKSENWLVGSFIYRQDWKRKIERNLGNLKRRLHVLKKMWWIEWGRTRIVKWVHETISSRHMACWIIRLHRPWFHQREFFSEQIWKMMIISSPPLALKSQGEVEVSKCSSVRGT